jgi:hypothetical protein
MDSSNIRIMILIAKNIYNGKSMNSGLPKVRLFYGYEFEVSGYTIPTRDTFFEG